MKSVIVLAVSFAFAMVTAVPDPLFTPRGELAPRQTSSGDDHALVGWVDATDGQCKLRFLTTNKTSSFPHGDNITTTTDHAIM